MFSIIKLYIYIDNLIIQLVMWLTCTLQTVPGLIGISIVVITVLFLLLKPGGSNGDRKQSKFPKTLQDPNMKYPLPLIEKEVSQNLNVNRDFSCEGKHRYHCNSTELLVFALQQEITHDTKKFRFGLPSSSHVLGLPIGRTLRYIPLSRQQNHLTLKSDTV